MKLNNLRITKINSDWDVSNYASSKHSKQTYDSRSTEQCFCSPFDDVSRILAALLRCTICYPFFLQFSENKAKRTMPKKKFEFGDKRNVNSYCYAPNWIKYYKTASTELAGKETAQNDIFRGSSQSSVLNYYECTNRCGKEGTKHTNKPRLIMQKLFYRIRKGPKPAKTVSGKSIEIHNTYSSTEGLPAGDGPQVKKEQLKRITAFFNDIYLEQQKFLDREKRVRVKNMTPKLDRKLTPD